MSALRGSTSAFPVTPHNYDISVVAIPVPDTLLHDTMLSLPIVPSHLTASTYVDIVVSFICIAAVGQYEWHDAV